MANNVTSKKPTNKQIYNLFATLQIRHDLAGYAYAKDFINEYFKSNGVPPAITKWYAIEASRVNKSPCGVERCIRSVVTSTIQATDDADLENFKNKIFITRNLTNKAFLYALCHYFEYENDTESD